MITPQRIFVSSSVPPFFKMYGVVLKSMVDPMQT